MELRLLHHAWSLCCLSEECKLWVNENQRPFVDGSKALAVGVPMNFLNTEILTANRDLANGCDSLGPKVQTAYTRANIKRGSELAGAP